MWTPGFVRARFVGALTVACGLIVAGGASSAAAKPTLGFAEQKPAMFSDSRFQALKTRQARVTVPWDVLADKSTLPGLDTWMQGAARQRVKVMITIQPSRRAGHQSINPSPKALAAEVRKWRQRWQGQVSAIATWNEPNLSKKPKVVAAWYLALRKACTSCTILAADLVDRPNAQTWAREFLRSTRGKLAPKVWGLHNYTDVNNFETKRTRAFLKAIPGRVWLTETGGVVFRKRPGAKFAGSGAAFAKKATSFLFAKVVPLSKRIERVYIFHWDTGPTVLNWDSAMIGPDDKERPALAVIRCYLKRGC